MQRTAPPCAGGIRLARRRLLRLGAASALGLAVTPLLAACEANAAGVTVEMTTYKQYDPSVVTIRRGAQVIWKNTSQRTHTATCDPARAQNAGHVVLPQGVAPWDSGAVYPGQTWARTFDTPGRYLYFCRYHETEGMIGMITVTD